jgi:hypothetical protein
LSEEVLATSLAEGAPADSSGYYSTEDDDLGLTIWLKRS